ncbi:MAG: nitrile hydratase accessory protein [Cyanobacteria bacterium P01_G01_bin.38]
MSPSLPDPMPKYPKGEHEPVFQAPWEAKAFAIVNQLTSAQHWSWPEWTDTFAQEISAAESDATDTSTYYERWVKVCETLLIEKGILDSDAIAQRIEALLSEREIEPTHEPREE